MKKVQSGLLALLLLCGFISCQKNITSEDRSLASAKKPQSSMLVQTIADGAVEGNCPACVASFTPEYQTAADYAVIKLEGETLVPAGTTTVTTIPATKQVFTEGNVIVTVSHDANNVYFTLERNNATGKFGNIRFHSPALLPVPDNGPGNYGVSDAKKVQVIRSRASLSACTSVSFSFHVSGGGSATDAGAVVTNSALTYILRDICPPVCTIEAGDYRTHSRGYWRNNDGQAFLTANSSLVDFTIGDGDNTENFATPASVKAFLESKPVANGTPGILPNGGTFAAHVLSLAINLKADEQIADYSAASGKLGNLVVAISEADIAVHPTWAQLRIWNGKSVAEIFAIAQKVLGGTEAAYSPSHMNELVSAINEAYEDGTVDTGFLTCGK